METLLSTTWASADRIGTLPPAASWRAGTPISYVDIPSALPKVCVSALNKVASRPKKWRLVQKKMRLAEKQVASRLVKKWFGFVYGRGVFVKDHPGVRD